MPARCLSFHFSRLCFSFSNFSLPVLSPVFTLYRFTFFFSSNSISMGYCQSILPHCQQIVRSFSVFLLLLRFYIFFRHEHTNLSRLTFLIIRSWSRRFCSFIRNSFSFSSFSFAFLSKSSCRRLLSYLIFHSLNDFASSSDFFAFSFFSFSSLLAFLRAAMAFFLAISFFFLASHSSNVTPTDTATFCLFLQCQRLCIHHNVTILRFCSLCSLV